MLSIAQEEAERRRRKRKKAGLRSAEIEASCPQAIVSAITQPPVGLAVYKADTHPEEYKSAIAELRAKALLPPEDGPASNVAEPPSVAVDKAHGADVGDFAVGLPDVVMSLPTTMETCVICLEDVVVGSRVRSLPCSHVYHAQCIRVWLRRKNACPCCCVKVIKRRKKRHRPPVESEALPQGPTETHAVADEQALGSLLPSTAPSPAVRTVSDNAFLSAQDTIPATKDRPADRGADGVTNGMAPRSKSMTTGADRPRWPGSQSGMSESFPRNISLLDPEDPTSEIFASDASSHMDESARLALMSQVRLALQGGSSLISMNTSVDDSSEMEDLRGGNTSKKCDADGDSFGRSSNLRDKDIENAKRLQGPSDVAADV